MLFLGRGVARLGLGVHGIEARQRRAIIHLVDDPALHPLLLRPFGQHMVEAHSQTTEELKGIVQAEKIKVDLPASSMTSISA